ncbi:peroxiredoxin [Aquitalea sp. S1-19]|nr:peroxiredoxin [Aquitalea sp. S1-19]
MDGQTCPDFTLPATSGLSFTLSAAQKPLVLYFYPKDNTPGCSNEAAAFRDLYSEFQAAGADIAGISRDSLKSHENFKTKFSLPFALLSDSEEVACGLFDVIKQKKMYGKEVRGIERSTFVIGADNQILKSWRGVKVAEHAAEVLAYIKGL